MPLGSGEWGGEQTRRRAAFIGGAGRVAKAAMAWRPRRRGAGCGEGEGPGTAHDELVEGEVMAVRSAQATATSAAWPGVTANGGGRYGGAPRLGSATKEIASAHAAKEGFDRSGTRGVGKVRAGREEAVESGSGGRGGRRTVVTRGAGKKTREVGPSAGLGLVGERGFRSGKGKRVWGGPIWGFIIFYFYFPFSTPKIKLKSHKF